MSIKSYFRRKYVKWNKRKDKIPHMEGIEKSVVEIFLNILRKKDSVLLSNTSKTNKKIIIKNGNNMLLMYNGVVTINTSYQNCTTIVGAQIETYLLKEFVRIHDKKIYRTEIEMNYNINEDLKNILTNLKLPNETPINHTPNTEFYIKYPGSENAV